MLAHEGLWPLRASCPFLHMALSIEPQAACTLKITGYGFSHAGFSASTFVPCFRILPWVEQRQARVLNGNCRTWSTPEDDGISNRGWKHLLHPLLRKNWDAFSDFQWFQLVPILDLTHCCKSIYKVSLANGLLCDRDSLLL